MGKLRDILNYEFFSDKNKVEVVEKKPNILKRFFDKHSPFITGVYHVSYILCGIWAFFTWVVLMFDLAGSGNFIGFVIGLFLQTLIIGFRAILGALVYGTIFNIILFPFYLMYRGLKK